MSGLFRLDSKDLLRGLVVAVLASVLTLVVRLIESKGFGLDLSDLSAILSTAMLAAVSYLSKNLLTDEAGRFGGRIQVK